MEQTKKSNKLKIIIPVAVVIVIVIVIAILIFKNFILEFVNRSTEPKVYTVYKQDATQVAEQVFHEVVKLKNEASYVLNASDVTYNKTMYEDKDSTYTIVTVVLDYSAQNGFGGLNRKNFTVQFTFDKATGQYYDPIVISNK